MRACFLVYVDTGRVCTALADRGGAMRLPSSTDAVRTFGACVRTVSAKRPQLRLISVLGRPGPAGRSALSVRTFGTTMTGGLPLIPPRAGLLSLAPARAARA